MVKTIYKWVSQEINKSLKDRCFKVCLTFFFWNSNDSFLDQIVTCDGKRTFYNNRKRSGQSITLLFWVTITFLETKIASAEDYGNLWSAIGVVHYRFLKTNKRIKAEVYYNQLEEIHIYLKTNETCFGELVWLNSAHDNERHILPGCWRNSQT